MIERLDGTKNGFKIVKECHPDELKDVLRPYIKDRSFRNIICNYRTCHAIYATPGNSFITVNNNLADGVFYVNRED